MIKTDNRAELVFAKQNEAYHRKRMEYFQEEIKIFESIKTKKRKSKT